MTTEERRAEVLRRLQAATSPLTGTRLSRELGVSKHSAGGGGKDFCDSPGLYPARG